MILAQIAESSFPSVSWLAIAPEIALAVGAVLVLLVDVQWKPERRVLGGLVTLVLAVAVGFSIRQWLRIDEFVDLSTADEGAFIEGFIPFGRMIVLDHASVIARFVILAATALGITAGWRLFERLGRRGAEGLALVLLSAAGFMFMASSIHLMMIFLGLEVGSISLYVLAGITRERTESDEAAIKYFLLGSVASAVFVYGVALVFAGTGTLNLVAARNFLVGNVLTRPAVLYIGVGLIVIGLAFKVSAAPFHSWAPDVYQGAPAGVVGYMAAVAKIGGFAALMRVLFTAFPGLDDEIMPVVAVIAALSMVLGSVVAIVQDDVRRLLAYSGIAHAGFILTGVVAGGDSMHAVWFYLAVYAVQLVGAFGVVAAVTGPGAGPAAMRSFSGLGRRQPVLAGLFSVILFGMGGIPLTSGFVAKFGVFQEAWRSGWEWLVIVAVMASVVAFFLYLRVIVAMYMQDEEGAVEDVSPFARWVPAIAAVVTIVFGLIPAPLLDLAGNATPL